MTDFRVHFDWNGNRHIVAIAADTPDAAASIITKRYPGAIVSKTKRDKSSGAINGRKASVIFNDECGETTRMSEMESLIASETLVEYKIAKPITVIQHKIELVPQTPRNETDAARNILNALISPVFNHR